MDRKEYKIGEIFEVGGGIKLQVVKASTFPLMSCNGCYFLGSEPSMCGLLKCIDFHRKDNTKVKFIRIVDEL